MICLNYNPRNKMATVIKLNHKTHLIKKYQFRGVPQLTIQQLQFYIRKQWIGKFWNVLNKYELVN